MNTGNSSRSSDLGVMSPARCRCAMPVKYTTFVACVCVTTFYVQLDKCHL